MGFVGYSLLWEKQDLYHQPYPLPSKDSYFKAFGPKDPILQGFWGYFDAKGISLDFSFQGSWLAPSGPNVIRSWPSHYIQ